jgi:hypothetical protein
MVRQLTVMMGYHIRFKNIKHDKTDILVLTMCNTSNIVHGNSNILVGTYLVLSHYYFSLL